MRTAQVWSQGGFVDVEVIEIAMSPGYDNGSDYERVGPHFVALIQYDNGVVRECDATELVGISKAEKS